MLTAATAHHLNARGLVTYGRTGTDCFLETLPPTPVAAVGVFSQPGTRSAGFRRPGVQLIVRGDSTGGRARTGYARAMLLLDALDGAAHETRREGTDDETRVAWVKALQAAPVSLGEDANGEARWSVRFDVELGGVAGRGW